MTSCDSIIDQSMGSPRSEDSENSIHSYRQEILADIKLEKNIEDSRKASRQSKELSLSRSSISKQEMLEIKLFNSKNNINADETRPEQEKLVKNQRIIEANQASPIAAKEMPNRFVDLLLENKESIRLTFCESLNCFINKKKLKLWKRFLAYSKKTVKDIKININASVLASTFPQIISEGDLKNFKQEDYSFLSHEHLCFLMTHFRNTLNRLIKNEILDLSIKCTIESVRFVSRHRSQLCTSFEDLVSVNFQAFVVSFTGISQDKSIPETLDLMKKQYIEAVYNESL